MLYTLSRIFREIRGKIIKICSKDGEFGQAPLSDVEEQCYIYMKNPKLTFAKCVLEVIKKLVDDEKLLNF